jgi:hypothetical protein
VVGIFGERFSETINLFQPHVIREAVHAAFALDRPRCGFARFRHGENFSSAEQVVTVMPMLMAQYVAYWRDFAQKRWSWSRLGQVIGTHAKLALYAKLRVGDLDRGPGPVRANHVFGNTSPFIVANACVCVPYAKGSVGGVRICRQKT